MRCGCVLLSTFVMQPDESLFHHFVHAYISLDGVCRLDGTEPICVVALAHVVVEGPAFYNFHTSIFFCFAFCQRGSILRTFLPKGGAGGPLKDSLLPPGGRRVLGWATRPPVWEGSPRILPPSHYASTFFVSLSAPLAWPFDLAITDSSFFLRQEMCGGRPFH